MGDMVFVDKNWRILWKDMGVSEPNILRRAGLPADLFGRDGAQIDAAAYFRLWEAFADESGIENMALTVGQAFTGEMFSPAIFAGLCSPDLGTAAGRFQMFKRLIGPFALGVESHPGHLTLTFSCTASDDMPEVIAAAELVFLVNFARMATREHVCPLDVTMTCALDDPDAYEEYFGVEVRQGDAFSIRFGAEDAARPFLTADDAMWAFFEPDLRKRLADLDQDSPFADRVRVMLVEMLPSGRSSLGDVARSLAVSSRTLQRRLDAENQRYQDVLNRTRERLARHYLTSSQMSSSEISLLLGYDDPNSFYRAFRQWTGSTPEAVRSSTQALA